MREKNLYFIDTHDPLIYSDKYFSKMEVSVHMVYGDPARPWVSPLER